MFSSITTPLTEIEFDVEEVSGVDKSEISSWSVAPNPANDVVNISGEYDYLVIYNVSGNEFNITRIHSKYLYRNCRKEYISLKLYQGNVPKHLNW